MDAISTGSTERYHELKTRVKRAFFEAAQALKEIYDRKLFLVEYENFESFCAHELGVGKSQAYSILKAGDVIENLSPVRNRGLVPEIETNTQEPAYLPSNLSQTRPLSKLDAEGQGAVWSEVTEEYEEREVTAAIVSDKVDAYLGNPTPGPTPGPTSPTKPTTSPATRPTAPEIYHAAFFTLKRINLDPCADEAKSVPADEHYTEGGLDFPWLGNIFLHAPENDLENWIAKAVNEIEEENASAIILYLPAEPWRGWNEHLKEFPRVYIREGAFSGVKNDGYKTGRMLVLIERNNKFIDDFISNTSHLGPIYGYIGE